jgi:hypothetical protein
MRIRAANLNEGGCGKKPLRTIRKPMVDPGQILCPTKDTGMFVGDSDKTGKSIELFDGSDLATSIEKIVKK